MQLHTPRRSHFSDKQGRELRNEGGVVGGGDPVALEDIGHFWSQLGAEFVVLHPLLHVPQFVHLHVAAHASHVIRENMF